MTGLHKCRQCDRTLRPERDSEYFCAYCVTDGQDRPNTYCMGSIPRLVTLAAEHLGDRITDPIQVLGEVEELRRHHLLPPADWASITRMLQTMGRQRSRELRAMQPGKGHLRLIRGGR